MRQAVRGPIRWRKWNANLVWRIEFDEGAVKDLRKLDKTTGRRITRFLRERLAALENPRSIGLPLRVAGRRALWRYRIGDWRIVARIEDGALRILIVRIDHQRSVYRGL